jgi:pimeloyl-ACP methyl ester carboxylesterase
MILNIEKCAVHYQEIGNGVPILIIHGWDSNADFMFNRWESAINWPDNYRRIYIDLPGHGRTQLSDDVQSADDMLRIIKGFTEKLFVQERYLVLGLSFGAYIGRGLIYSEAERIDGICMLVPLIIADETKRSLVPLEVFEDNSSLSNLFMEEYQIIYELLTVRNDQTLNEWKRYNEIVDKAPGDTAFREEMRADPYRYALSHNVDKLKIPYDKPTLIITGRQDNKVGYKDAWAILDNYPRATFVVLDRTGHLMENQDETIAQLILDWLFRVDKARKFS